MGGGASGGCKGALQGGTGRAARGYWKGTDLQPIPAGDRGRAYPGKPGLALHRRGGWTPPPESCARSAHALSACSRGWVPCASPASHHTTTFSKQTEVGETCKAHKHSCTGCHDIASSMVHCLHTLRAYAWLLGMWQHSKQPQSSLVYTRSR